MRKLITLCMVAACMLLWACNPNYEEPDTAIDAGRQFISAIYNGNFKRAGQLIIPDDANRQILNATIEKDFRSRNSFDKEMLSKASIQIIEISTLDSSVTLIKFLNAYTGKEDYLEVIRTDMRWKVNLERKQ